MEFVVYKKFIEEEYAVGLAELLKSRGIEFQLTSDRDSLDSLYGDKYFKKEFFVKIRRNDFPVADAMMAELGKAQLQDVDPEHYLLSFSAEELREVLQKQDEWNEFDVQLARKILQDRGEKIDDEDLAELKAERIAILAAPEQSKPIWTVVGYISAAFGGLLGIAIGWHMMSFKKTLPNGQRVHGFSAGDRDQGLIIMIIGIVMFVGLTIYRFWLYE